MRFLSTQTYLIFPEDTKRIHTFKHSFILKEGSMAIFLTEKNKRKKTEMRQQYGNPAETGLLFPQFRRKDMKNSRTFP